MLGGGFNNSLIIKKSWIQLNININYNLFLLFIVWKSAPGMWHLSFPKICSRCATYIHRLLPIGPPSWKLFRKRDQVIIHGWNSAAPVLICKHLLHHYLGCQHSNIILLSDCLDRRSSMFQTRIVENGPVSRLMCIASLNIFFLDYFIATIGSLFEL